MTDYGAMNVRQLRQLVREQGWKGSSVEAASKAELITFLKTGEKPNKTLPVTLADESPIVMLSHTAHAPAGLEMEFSSFARRTDSTAKPLVLNLEGFLALLGKRFIRSGKDGKMFAPAKFSGKRSNENFIESSAICLDLDRGHPSIGSVLELFPGTLAAYYTTHSHTHGNTRFRVVIPLSRPVNADEHTRLVVGVKSIITPELNECIDSTCFEKARAHYLPSCPKEHELHAFTGHQDGEPLDVDHFLNLRITTPATGQSVDRPEPALAAPRSFEFADPATGEVIDLVKWAAQNPDFDLVNAIDQRYWRGTLKDGKQHINCPFEDQHTDQGKDFATYAVNASPPRHKAWDIHCCHAHCSGRDRLEFILAMLEMGWLTIDQLQTAPQSAIVRRRPPKVNYPVNDILADPAWTALIPDERRVALDLMTKFWAEDDGMIKDEDWVIARRLGMTIEEWQQYRETFTRAGWLIESEGRLTNHIAKREFDKAQDAYMKAITKAQRGGKATQEKARLKHQLEAPA